MIAQARVEPNERHANHFLERDPLLLHGERAALHPDHVEQVGHEARHATRFVQNRLGQLPPGLGRQRRTGVEQAARRALDAAERRAQVVRQGTEEAGAEALGFHFHATGLVALGKSGTLERHRGLTDEGFELLALFRIGDVARIARLDSHHAEDTLGGLQRKVERR